MDAENPALVGRVMVSRELVEQMGGKPSDAVHVRIRQTDDPGTVDLTVWRCGPCAERCEHAPWMV